jgi:hypothetical protein
MQPAVSLLKALNQVTEWEASRRRITTSPDADSLRAFVCGADNLKEAAILMSAPDGIAAVTPETTLLHSGKGFTCRAWARSILLQRSVIPSMPKNNFSAGPAGGDSAGFCEAR